MSLLKLVALFALVLLASAHLPNSNYDQRKHGRGKHGHPEHRLHEHSEFSDLSLIAELESELTREEFSEFSQFSESSLPPCHPPCKVGHPCSDNNPCTTLDACLPTKFGHKCIGRKPLKCPRAPNECHEDAVWEPNCELNICNCRYAFKKKGTACRWGVCDGYGACLPSQPFNPYETSELIEELEEDLARHKRLHHKHGEESSESGEESSESSPRPSSW